MVQSPEHLNFILDFTPYFFNSYFLQKLGLVMMAASGPIAFLGLSPPASEISSLF